MEYPQLKRAGLKTTLPRVRVLELLQSLQNEDGPHHLTAEELYRRLSDEGSDFSLATVYRVLSHFETAGLVKRHHFEGGQARFELADGEHHDHIVCMQCGKVEEFVDDLIEERQKRIAQQREFDLREYSLVLYANCLRRCDNEEKESGSATTGR
ncbi:ferric iron uptake transcriptional regulator [Aquisalimonas sp. 2447]|uniref:ferric iron uptake transcriptional regulator n=1 Tax=Aquisalimonas sp. 2447 TaxID=2740807 RepID=UPI0014326E41|nr:ferric iron uptake transcriptional regulator [Aquisalimonas sp. 2447]QIT56922.1 ferric iron uptake transcriptional regulator [Aquisalimonas sp. 2447]